MDVVLKLRVSTIPHDSGACCRVEKLGPNRVYSGCGRTSSVSVTPTRLHVFLQSNNFRIYAVRLTLSTFYEYRISKAQANVDTLQKQRDITIDKLKAATKYNTTQQLLEKYGGTPSRSKSSGHPIRKTDLQGGSNSPKDVRTRFVPPATANIPGRNIPASLPSTPQRSTPASVNLGSIPFTAAAATPPWQQQSSPVEQTAEFAPNAFSAAPQYAQVGERPKWYDRFMDILLGEDETNPRNRIILICNNCRLVNGQAPPGVKQLEDVGTWRCSGCGVMNGEETEAKRLVAQISKQAKSREALSLVQQEESSKVESDQNDDEVVLVGREVDHESDITQYSDDELEALVEGEQEPIEEGGKLQEVEEEAKPEKPKRGRPKGSVKKKA